MVKVKEVIVDIVGVDAEEFEVSPLYGLGG